MQLKKAQIVGSLFTIILGTLLHFLYDWSGQWHIIGAFSAVNESVFEHLKLLFVPMLIFAVVEYLAFGKGIQNFIQVRFLSVLLGMAVIVIGFYTYSGIIGKNYLIIDIILFVLAVFISYYYSYKLFQTDKFTSKGSKRLAVFGIIFLIIITVIFTYSPPHLQLFFDTQSKSFGIPPK